MQQALQSFQRAHILSSSRDCASVKAIFQKFLDLYPVQALSSRLYCFEDEPWFDLNRLRVIVPKQCHLDILYYEHTSDFCVLGEPSLDGDSSLQQQHGLLATAVGRSLWKFEACGAQWQAHLASVRPMFFAEIGGCSARELQDLQNKVSSSHAKRHSSRSQSWPVVGKQMQSQVQ